MKDGMKQDANEKHIPTCSTEEKHPDDQCKPHGHVAYDRAMDQPRSSWAWPCYESQDSAED